METGGSLWRYPVKSMMGEQVASAHVTARGLAGDRTCALVDKAANRAAVVRIPATPPMSNRATFDAEPLPDQPSPAIRVTDPDGATWSSAEPGSDARFDRPLSLMSHVPVGLLLGFLAGTAGGKMADVTEVAISSAAPSDTYFDVASLHLLTTATLERIRSAHPQGRIDVRRFRPNIVIATDAEPFAENAWAGRRFAIGADLVVKGIMPTPRCVNTTIPRWPRPSGRYDLLAGLIQLVKATLSR